jgi:hypothetical protein
LRAFVDVTALHPGDRADKKILDSARKAPVGLVLFDNNFLLRQWPMAELKLIVEEDTLLPVIIGMSHAEFEAAWRASEVASQLDDALFEHVIRTTFVVDEGGWQGELRQRICFAVTRMFVESVCSRYSDTTGCVILASKALKAAKAISDRCFRELTGRDYAEAEQWIKELEMIMSRSVLS